MITPASGRDDLAQDLLEPLAFGVGKFAADSGRRGARHVDQVATGQRHLRGQSSALVTDGILADLHHDVVAGLERLLDLAVGPAESGGLPVHLAGVEHAVAAAADVDERRLHRRQHVLHDAQVDVADQGRRSRAGDEVFDDDAVLEHGDLGVATALVRRFGADLVADHHHPLDRLAAGQEFGFGQDRRAPASGVTAVAAALPLGFQPGRAVDALDLVVAGVGFVLGSGRPLVHDGVRRVVRRRVVLGVVAGTGLAATTATAALGGTLAGTVVVVGAIGVVRVVIGVVVVGGVIVVGRLV